MGMFIFASVNAPIATSAPRLRNPRPWSTYAMVFIVLMQLWALRNGQRWMTGSTISWDMQEYYIYLPATFIHHDLGFEFVENLPEEQKAHYWIGDSPSGRKVGRMSLGMAIAYTPAFIIGHAAAAVLGQPRDGFSKPYQFVIQYIGVLYALLGFIFLRRLLRRYFPDPVIALTLLTLGIGTNLYYYSTTEGAMSHAPLFALSACFLYYVVRWHEEQRWSYLFSLGFCLGLAALIRPTNVLIILIFAGYGIYSRGSLQAKIKLLWARRLQLLALALLLALMAFPQMLYWKMQTGHWVYYSYDKQGFFFDRPRIWKGLFSIRKGWLVYTPLISFALVGLYFVRRYSARLSVVLPVYVCIVVYVVLSWWCWWYGGSFGLRSMIETYAFLAFPLAAFWDVLRNSRQRALYFGALTVATLLVYLNLFQSYQYRAGMLHWDSMNKEIYKATFLKDGHMDGKVKDSLIEIYKPDYDAAMRGEDEWTASKTGQPK